MSGYIYFLREMAINKKFALAMSRSDSLKWAFSNETGMHMIIKKFVFYILVISANL